MIGPLADPHQFQALDRCFMPRFAVYLVHTENQLDILIRRECWQQTQRLKDKADLFPAPGGELAFIPAPNFFAKDADVAARSLIQPT